MSDQNEPLNKQLEQAEQNLKAQTEAMNSNQTNLRKINAELKETEISLEELKKQGERVSAGINQISREMRQNQKQIETLKSTIAENEHNQKVDALMNKQKDFWSALLARLIHQQHEVNSDLVDFGEQKNPRDVISELKKWVEGRGISEDLVALRNFTGFYNQAIRKLCEAKVKGEYVSAEMKADPKKILDRCLFSRIVESRWNT